ncbi:hypothetical protein NQ314_012138 [Rhamnusium bicolor]|uniref:Uncharacterized protein n=1 Tax=Rhamnusium bicolor TaxID=1586634 RepID=A0AAV8XEC5_9CUCU|nr:hypothetical protein NQ314_012138 [Rhamnusium bicolor]
MGEIEGEKMSVEEVLQNDIDALRIELDQVKDTLSTLSKEKEEATERCKEMEEYIAKMGLECRETMNMVSSSIEWGKGKNFFSLIY